MIGRRLVGAIATVHSDPQRVFGQEDLRLLNLFAPQAAIAIENARDEAVGRDLDSLITTEATRSEAIEEEMQDLQQPGVGDDLQKMRPRSARCC